MTIQGNHQSWLRSKAVRIVATVGILSCTTSYAQPEPGMRPRPPELVRAGDDRADKPVPSEQRGKMMPPERLGPPRFGQGRPGLPGPGGRPRPWGEVPEPERDQIQRFIEEHFPRMYVELQRLKSGDEPRYMRRMTHIAPPMRQIMEAMRTDPQRGALMIRERQLDFEIRQTVAQYHQAEDEAAKERIRAHLEEVCGKVFDCRSERRQMEVRELEARLTELQTRLSESEKMRPALIRQRASELLERPAPRPGGEEGRDGPPRPDGPEPEPD